MLNYGDLDILTAADVAIDRYRMLNHAKAFKKLMLTQKHALETDSASAARADAAVCAPDARHRASQPPPATPLAAPRASAVACDGRGHRRRPPPHARRGRRRTVARGHRSARAARRPARLGRHHAPSEYEPKKEELLGRL